MSDLLPALAERLRQADKRSDGTWTWEMVAEVVLAFVAEQLPTRGEIEGLIRREMCGTCRLPFSEHLERGGNHNFDSVGGLPLQAAALLRDLRERLGVQ